MTVFPLFVDLKEKRCIVVGGGKVAQRKIMTLLKFNARITVISPHITEELDELKQEGKIIVVKKRYSDGDLHEAFLAIAATDDTEVNDLVYRHAMEEQIPVNVATDPQKCTFIFPSVVTRRDLVIGISSSAAYPGFSRALREKIDRFIPQEYGLMLEILKNCRIRAEREIQNELKKRQLLEKLLNELLFFENAVTQHVLMERIDNLFKEYADEKTY